MGLQSHSKGDSGGIMSVTGAFENRSGVYNGTHGIPGVPEVQGLIRKVIESLRTN